MSGAPRAFRLRTDAASENTQNQMMSEAVLSFLELQPGCRANAFLVLSRRRSCKSLCTPQPRLFDETLRLPGMDAGAVRGRRTCAQGKGKLGTI